MFSDSEDWALDPLLARDTAPVGDLPLCRVLLIDDATHPWLLLVPRRPGASEVFDLGFIEQMQLTSEIAHVAEVLKAETGCDKINVAALGNVVAQLHVHIIARFRHDAAWPKPVWGQAPARPYIERERTQLLAALRPKLVMP